MSVQVGYNKQFLFGFLFLLIILTGIETSLRIYEYITIPCSIYENDAFVNLSYFEIKNICYSENTLVHGKAPLYLAVPNQYKFTININSDGFRGNEINENNDYRIFLTGGSTAFGFGSTSDQTSISGFLQKFFDNDLKDLNIEIINAGVNGADSYREILLIKENLIHYEPDLIISYTGVNDADGYSREIILDETIDDYVKNPLKFSSYPWYRTPFVINNLISPIDISSEKQILLTEKQIQLDSESFRSNWLQSCDYLQKNNISSMVILQPSLSTKKNPSDFEKQLSFNINEEKMLDRFSKELKTLDKNCNHTFDIRDAMENLDETTYYDALHLNDLGNEVIAKKIYEKILPIVIKDIKK